MRGVHDEEDSPTHRARASARAGAWESVRTILVDSPDAATRPEAAVLLAEAQLRTGRPRDARAWLTQEIPAIALGGDRAARRRAVNLLGAAHLECGDLADAKRAFARAVELGRQDGDDLLAARALNNLALIVDMSGHRESALALFHSALLMYERMGHALGIGECFHNMAVAHRALGALDRADEAERRAIEFARQAGDGRLEAMARVGRAEVELQRGDPRLAAAAARRAAIGFAAIPDRNLQADALRLAGVALLAVGALRDAGTELDLAVALATEHGNALIEAEARRARAELRARIGETVTARDDGAIALGLFERLGMQAERDALAAWLNALQ